MLSLLVCSALAFDHYWQGPPHRAGFPATEPKAVTRPLDRTSAPGTVRSALGDASLSDVPNPPVSDATGDLQVRDIGTPPRRWGPPMKASSINLATIGKGRIVDRKTTAIVVVAVMAAAVMPCFAMLTPGFVRLIWRQWMPA